MTDEKSFVSGAISVKAVVECGKRAVYTVYIGKNKIANSKDYRYIKSVCDKKNIRCELKDEAFFDMELLGKTHGCICAEVGEIKTEPLSSLLSDEKAFIVYLDGIEDPYNFGDSIRTLYAAGATGIVLSPRNWLSASGIVLRASAGASERIRCAVCDDIPSFISECKFAGLMVAAADRRESVPMYSADFTVPLFMILGGEKRGISSSVLSLVDKRVYIPYGRDCRNALSASSSVSVIAFEIARQRMFK